MPVYGQWPLTEACLRSLAVSTLDVPDLEVLAVDNGAAAFPAESAACAALGRALFGARFRYLPQPENRNFAGGRRGSRSPRGFGRPGERGALAAPRLGPTHHGGSRSRNGSGPSPPGRAVRSVARALAAHARFGPSSGPDRCVEAGPKRSGKLSAVPRGTPATPGRLRPALRVRCPELADEPNRVLTLESAFQRDEYLPFERQVLYKEGQ